MKFRFGIALFVCLVPGVALAGKKPLLERILTLDTSKVYDEEYNNALDEMQNLEPSQKLALSNELATVLTGDKNRERRANAASALGDLCSEVKKNDEALAKGAKDKEKIVRQAVASGVGRCGATPTAISTLKNFLKDSEATVRAMAEIKLEQWGAGDKKN